LETDAPHTRERDDKRWVACQNVMKRNQK